MVSQFGQGKGGGQGYRENLQFLCGLVNSVFFLFWVCLLLLFFWGVKKSVVKVDIYIIYVSVVVKVDIHMVYF